MAFSRKTWVDRLTEFPTRRILTDTQGNETTVTVARSEGTVSQEGDAFNAENMNGLEGRIAAEFTRLDENLTSMFISLDTSNILTTLTNSNGVKTYTATQDCFVCGEIMTNAQGKNVAVDIDNVCIIASAYISGSSQQVASALCAPLAKGQTVRVYGSGTSGGTWNIKIVACKRTYNQV